ncbi:amidase family protein [Rugosimonospora africana]|uniref:Amidase n=1 Tax=Rugosimonospora africana TaxID=556532 RepID=A0A8J3QTG6_9ACTN|nr:amidase family protein [Rugosimonospora africana]GIH15682.1 amidase [Rugosimonospora africana]
MDLETATVAQLGQLLQSRRISAVDLASAYLARIRQYNSRGPALNAVRAINPAALDEARAADAVLRSGKRHGPLLGIPVLLKDNIDVRGMPTTAGSVALAHSYPSADAPLVTGLKKAGAVILGKANLTEFANFLTSGMPGGYSSLGGQVLNPYDASQTPSGSSSGPGVAAAFGFAPLTVGTETSGSILSPSAANSDVGIKPTVGLVSRTGIVPIAASQDTAGPIVKTVADAAAELTALTTADPLDPATAQNPLLGHDFTADLSTTALRGARIGVVASQVPAAGTDTRTLWDAATAALTAAGATLVPVSLDTGSSIPGGSSVLTYEFKRDLDTYLSRLPANAPMKSLADIVAYNDAHADVALKFGQTNALASQAKDLSPGSADTAKYLADRAQDLADSRDRIDAVMAANDLTALLFAGSGSAGIGAKAGYPSISVPAGYQASNRRPFNISFLGRAWSEPTLIGLGYAYEQATMLRRPPSRVNPSLFRCAGPGGSDPSCAP